MKNMAKFLTHISNKHGMEEQSVVEWSRHGFEFILSLDSLVIMGKSTKFSDFQFLHV